MATINKQEFDTEDVQLAEFARVMGHPGRIAILKTLAERNECVCGEIVDVLPLAQATVSQHLKELKKMGLVKGRISGVKSCYCIDWEGFERFTNAMKEYVQKMENLKQLGLCCTPKN